MAIRKSELYSSLWSSCDELRGGMDASQYKDYVLVLLFIKYISDKYADVQYAPITIPKGASFKDMVALKGKPDIGDQINKKIIAPLADANKLSDMPDFYDSNKLGSGKYVVDWRDGAGIRHWKTFDKKGAADDFRDKVGPEARQRLTPSVPSTSTVREYAEHWKELIGHTVKPRTLARYTEILTLHVLPRFEKVRVRDLDRGRIKFFLADKLNTGLEKRTVRNIQSVLRILLNAAIEDRLIVANPAANLGRVLKLTVSKGIIQEEIKAMTKAQRQLFLATAFDQAPRYYPLFRVLAGTGMRLGEALALQPEDVDLTSKSIRIARAFSEDGTLDTPKSGHGRSVEMSHPLAHTLAAHDMARKQDRLKYGGTEASPWLFVTKEGTPIDPANVRRAMQRILKTAKLPLHFTPHCLRHTYASILLADGVSPVYVQEQLGHATIELTVSTYGRWLKKKAPGALDRLDGALTFESGSKVVAEGAYAQNPQTGSKIQLPEIP